MGGAEIRLFWADVPAVDGDGGHARPLDPPDQTDGVVQLKPVHEWQGQISKKRRAK